MSELMVVRVTRLVIAFTVVLGALAVVPGAGTVHAQDDDEQALAERYAPIVMVRTQAEACDADGEPFAPMSVDLLLGNDQIALRQVGNGDPTVTRGPSARDLADLGEGFYLDFPGDSLRPGCVYEQDHDRYNAGQPAVVYAHVAEQADRPGYLALQYWLFWYYNDWNNKHEGDWEFVQLLFEATSVAEALERGPVSVGYAQHEGGERAGWDDGKLQREGTHPVVYSSQRSHASYYSAALYMGRSGSEGFGCDETEEPSTRVEPDVVVLPDAVDDADDPLAWVGFDGRWGERHASPNNGPTGPNTKPQWTAPVTWHDGLRDSSFVVPTGDTRGTELVDTFCDVVEWGSVQFIRFVASPARMLLVLAVLVALATFLVRRTSWAVVDAAPLARRRRVGEIARVAARQYRARPGTFAAASLLAIPVALLALVAGALVRRLPFLGDLVEVADPSDTGTKLFTSTVIATGLALLAFVLVTAAVARIVDDAGAGRASARDAARAVWVRLGGLVVAVVIAALVLGVLGFTVVGLPIAVWLFVRWQFLAPVAMLEGKGLEGTGGPRALARSAELVRGRWWHTALVTWLVLTFVGAVGLVVGLVLLVLFTGLPLWALSAVVAACDVLVMPYAALVMTYLYGNALAAGAAAQPDPSADPVSA